MKKIYLICNLFVMGIMSADQSDLNQDYYETEFREVMSRRTSRLDTTNAVKEIRTYLNIAEISQAFSQATNGLVSVMQENAESRLLLNAAIVTDAKKQPTILSRQSLQPFIVKAEDIVRTELQRYRSVSGLEKAYEKFLPEDIDKLLLEDFADEVENKKLVTSLKKLVEQRRDETGFLADFIKKYYQATFKKQIQSVIDSDTQDKQGALNRLYEKAIENREEGYLQDVLIEFYKEEVRREQSVSSDSPSLTPVKDFCENLASQQNDTKFASFSRQLSKAWINVTEESLSTMTEKQLIQNFNFLQKSSLKIDPIFVQSSLLRTMLSAVNPKEINSMSANLYNNKIFNRFPRLWFVIAKSTLDPAGPNQTDRVITALNSSIPKERGWNKLKKNVKAWFGEYCNLHRLRLKVKTKKATDVDRYRLAEQLIKDRELTGALRGVDTTPEELCQSIRIVLQRLQGTVDGQPALLLKILRQADGLTLQMIQSEIIDRLPQSIRVNFMKKMGAQQPDLSLNIDSSSQEDDNIERLLEADSLLGKPSGDLKSRRKGGSPTPGSVSSGQQNQQHLMLDTSEMSQEEIRRRLEENTRIVAGNDDHSEDLFSEHGK